MISFKGISDAPAPAPVAAPAPAQLKKNAVEGPAPSADGPQLRAQLSQDTVCFSGKNEAPVEAPAPAPAA